MGAVICVVVVSGCALKAGDAGGSSAVSASPAITTQPEVTATDFQELKRQIAEQQKELTELRLLLLDQKRQIDSLKTQSAASSGASSPAPASTERNAENARIASLSPILPPAAAAAPGQLARSSEALALQAAAAQPPGAQAGAPNPLQRAVDTINNNLRGFRLSGDMRFRTDILVRDANTSLPSSDNRAIPQQRARERYRARFNLDKDLFYRDGGSTLAHFHLQLATDPYSNPITMDTDFSGITTRAPFSIAEAYLDLTPIKGLTLRAGRTPEIYADNRQFVYDDDVRFNGFHEVYRWTAQNKAFIQFGAAQYILTDPNTQIVPAGSPFLAAGYRVGQRIPSSALFDQGITVGNNFGSKWSQNVIANYFAMREPNQIQLASTAGGAALFANSPILGATLIGNLPGTGNATTTAGGAMYFGGFQVIRVAYNLNYTGTQWHRHNFPFALFGQTTHNFLGRIENNGYMLGAAIGQTTNPGDIQFQYQYFYKPANAFVSQFTDDDVGTGAGVNVKTQQVRINFGLTRFLAWENRFYIQKGIALNNPAIGFFVPLQQGYNTQLRIHSQFVFTF
ncbi:MAG: hypothetical protein C5B51_02640 [Terriglobia bacterium]|nr:MAG: hypothetical protein C5B51_02640 [Terriglobia bacterium]